MFFFGHLGFKKRNSELLENERLYLKWKTVLRRIVNRSIEKLNKEAVEIGGSLEKVEKRESGEIAKLKKFLRVRSTRRKEGLFKNKVKESLFKILEMKYKQHLGQKAKKAGSSASLTENISLEVQRGKESLQEITKAAIPISFTRPIRRTGFKKKNQGFILSQMSDEELSMILPFMLFPFSRFRNLWDISIVILVLYNVLILPMQIGLGLRAYWLLNGIDNLANILFGIDIILNFFTGFISESNKLVMNPKMIAKNYLKSWFLLDVLATFPFEWPLLIFGGKGADINVNVLSILKTPRILRLGRILKFMENLKSANIWRIIRLFVMFFLSAHWVGCIWYWIASTPEKEIEVRVP